MGRRRKSKGAGRAAGSAADVVTAGLPRLTRSWAPAVIVAAAVIPYLTALPGDFVSDARAAIAQNRQLLGSGEWLAWFSRDYFWGSGLVDVNLYRPLTVLSYLLNLRTTGTAPAYFIALNVLLHAGASVLVWRLGVRLLGPLPALAGALLFAVHPIHAEAVAWVMGRAELLAAVFGLGACLLAVRVAESGGRRPWRFVLAALAAFAGAILSKEHVALLPLWFALLWLLRRRAPGATAAAGVAAGSFLVFAGFLLLREHALTRVSPLGDSERALMLEVLNPAAGAPLPSRWLTAMAVVWRYALLFVWPLRLSHDYSYAETRASAGLGLAEAAGLLVTLVLLGAIVAVARRLPGLALTLALVPVTFALVSNIPFPIGTIMAERLLYLPSAGLCLAAGWLLTRLPLPEALTGWIGPDRAAPGGPGQEGRAPLPVASARRADAHAVDSQGWIVVGMVVAVALGLAGRTLARNVDWQSDYALFSSALRASPRSAHAHTAMAELEIRRGNLDRATVLARAALDIHPKNFSAIALLGDIHYRRNDLQAAVEHYRRAIGLAPGLPGPHAFLGMALTRMGRLTEAEHELKETIRLTPDGAYEARLHLGQLLLETGRPAEALQVLQAASRLNPRDPVPVFGMATAALALGDRQAAAAYARQAAAAGLAVPQGFWRALEPLN